MADSEKNPRPRRSRRAGRRSRAAQRVAERQTAPSLTGAQSRYLRKLIEHPGYVGRKGRTKQTAEALVRKGVARVESGGGLVALWNPDTQAWRTRAEIDSLRPFALKDTDR